jgi:hypothetical protein
LKINYLAICLAAIIPWAIVLSCVPQKTEEPVKQTTLQKLEEAAWGLKFERGNDRKWQATIKVDVGGLSPTKTLLIGPVDTFDEMVQKALDAANTLPKG